MGDRRRRLVAHGRGRPRPGARPGRRPRRSAIRSSNPPTAADARRPGRRAWWSARRPPGCGAPPGPATGPRSSGDRSRSKRAERLDDGDHRPPFRCSAAPDGPRDAPGGRPRRPPDRRSAAAAGPASRARARRRRRRRPRAGCAPRRARSCGPLPVPRWSSRRTSRGARRLGRHRGDGGRARPPASRRRPRRPPPEAAGSFPRSARAASVRASPAARSSVGITTVTSPARAVRRLDPGMSQPAVEQPAGQPARAAATPRPASPDGQPVDQPRPGVGQPQQPDRRAADQHPPVVDPPHRRVESERVSRRRPVRRRSPPVTWRRRAISRAAGRRRRGCRRAVERHPPGADRVRPNAAASSASSAGRHDAQLVEPRRGDGTGSTAGRRPAVRQQDRHPPLRPRPLELSRAVRRARARSVGADAPQPQHVVGHRLGRRGTASWLFTTTTSFGERDHASSRRRPARRRPRWPARRWPGACRSSSRCGRSTRQTAVDGRPQAETRSSSSGATRRPGPGQLQRLEAGVEVEVALGPVGRHAARMPPTPVDRGAPGAGEVEHDPGGQPAGRLGQPLVGRPDQRAEQRRARRRRPRPAPSRTRPRRARRPPVTPRRSAAPVRRADAASVEPRCSSSSRSRASSPSSDLVRRRRRPLGQGRQPFPGSPSPAPGGGPNSAAHSSRTMSSAVVLAALVDPQAPAQRGQRGVEAGAVVVGRPCPAGPPAGRPAARGRWRPAPTSRCARRDGSGWPAPRSTTLAANSGSAPGTSRSTMRVSVAASW